MGKLDEFIKAMDGVNDRIAINQAHDLYQFVLGFYNACATADDGHPGWMPDYVERNLADCDKISALLTPLSGRLPADWEKVLADLPRMRAYIAVSNDITKVRNIRHDYNTSWRYHLVAYADRIRESAAFLKSLPNPYHGLDITSIRQRLDEALAELA